MAVVDYTSQLALGPDMTAFNDKYCVLGAGDVVTVSFSGTVSKSINAVVAIVPQVLRANISNIFSGEFDHTTKEGSGVRLTQNGEIIINNSVAGHAYWIGITYVRRTN